jgi:C1A family cysteine protease
MRQFLSGWQPSRPDHRDHKFAAGSAVQALPSKIDLRTAAVSIPPLEPNWDQGQLGSCGPHASGANLAFDMLADGIPAVMPSRLFIYYCTRFLMGTVGSDSGVDNRSMMKALAQFGWCDESLWTYDISRFTQKPPQAAFDQASTRKIKEYLSVPQNLTQMKACLAGDSANGVKGRPFVFGFTVYSSFMSAAVEATGDVPMPGMQEEVEGGHDVLIDGYDDATQRFYFDNSWSEQWGRGGRGTIPYAYATSPDLSGDFWVIRGSGAGPGPGPGPSPNNLPARTITAGWRNADDQVSFTASFPAGVATIQTVTGSASRKS